MRRLDCKLYRETLDSQIGAGRYNPASVIKPTLRGQKRRHVLPCGDTDLVDVYTEADLVLVVSINRQHGYCGIQAYDPEDQEPREELGFFLQYDHDIAATLGPRGLDLADRTIARRLADTLFQVIA